ncbi:MAG: transcription elongation factor GreB [Gammaproteobacteria bacterium]
MNKAFVREDAADHDDEIDAGETAPVAPGGRNYMTPAGHERMKSELLHLLDAERPEMVRIVSWAASNGDRSENGDYIYGKKRLREIDRRIRFLTRRLDAAEVVDPARQQNLEQVFFGATVTYLRASKDAPRDGDESEETITIVGIDEVDPARRRVSWISPIARALMKSREGDLITLRTPAGVDELEVLEVRYDPVD